MFVANLAINKLRLKVFMETLRVLSYFLLKLFVQIKVCSKFASAFTALAYGVTGNTSDFGSEESRFEP